MLFVNISFFLAAHLLPWEAIFNDVLGQAKMVQDESLLPNTGVDKEIERLESGVFVHPYDKPVSSNAEFARF